MDRATGPDDRSRVFTLLLSETRDVFGNAVVYEYQTEDNAGVDVYRRTS